MTELSELLEKLGTLHYKYSLLEEKDRFNIFEILRKNDDEVHLHSRFIAELLNPKGSHGFDSVFLKLFIDVLLKEKDSEFSNLEKAIVLVEKNIGEINKDKDTGGRIDILIENIGNSPIVIENKIHAKDQSKQLLRYYNYNPNSYIFYLTLYGSEPSEDALGGNKDDKVSQRVLQLSYKSDINSWLELCIEKAAMKPELRETILQYKKLINKLTGDTMSKAEFNDIYDLISKNDNIINARLIGENWNKIKIRTELKFWKELERVISAKYDISKKAQFSEAHIKKNVLQERGNNTYYGLVFKTGKVKEKDILFKIEKGSGLMFYGFITEDEEIRKRLNDCISEMCDHQYNHLFVGWKYIEGLNFSSFSTPETMKMCNEDYRIKAVLQYWNEIQNFINNCEQSFGIMDYHKEN